MKRFDIVVFNYDRLKSFINNIDKIHGLKRDLDRITIVSASPSEEEYKSAQDLAREQDIDVCYIRRRNYGFDQYARCEYFSGRINSIGDNLSYTYVFQMQDHYLDTISNWSKWGKGEGFRVKGDVIPNGTIFDLDVMEDLLVTSQAVGMFCDRNNPSIFIRNRIKYIAPNGGNFIIRSSEISKAQVQKQIELMISNCDNTYYWANYAEYMWGQIFFPDGTKVYDLKRNKLYTSFESCEFYIAPKRIQYLMLFYDMVYKFPFLKQFVRFYALVKIVKHNASFIE